MLLMDEMQITTQLSMVRSIVCVRVDNLVYWRTSRKLTQ
jgi:hypothetical protein